MRADDRRVGVAAELAALHGFVPPSVWNGKDRVFARWFVDRGGKANADRRGDANLGAGDVQQALHANSVSDRGAVPL